RWTSSRPSGPAATPVTRRGSSTPRPCWAATNSCSSIEAPLMSHPESPVLTRRQAIQRLGGGFGALGLASLLAAEGRAVPAPARGTHIAPRARRVIQLFMNGGPFGPDLFDPKPAINRCAGQRPDAVRLRTENETGGLMPVPFGFRRCGKSGLEVSELLPRF